MTILENFYHAPEYLVLPKARVFYPLKIPVRHWQLRSLISVSSSDTLYYASDVDIYRLHTPTRKRELLATLRFEPRCLAADYGWLCAGGSENGQFAFMKIQETSLLAQAEPPTPPRDGADVDSLLPLDLDPDVRRQTHNFLTPPPLWNEAAFERRPEVHTQELGLNIVNSVTIHQSRFESHGQPEGTLAVLTNNDKAVRIFSMTQSRLLATLDFPVEMNHASISPDGKILVAVGDDPIVYFHKRMTHGPYKWLLCSTCPLKPSALFQNGTCFATAFSPSGRFCAVASQDGMITVFEVRLLEEFGEEAVITVIPSSRPHTSPGAIRSMCFSPEPFELLICTEHSGKVCIADMRSGYRARQVVDLFPGDALEQAEILDDFLVEDLIDPRLRTESDSDFTRLYRQAVDGQDGGTVAPSHDEVGSTSERRRTQQRSRDVSPQLLTEHERQIVDALRTSRERIEAREQQRPISVNYSRDVSARQQAEFLAAYPEDPSIFRPGSFSRASAGPDAQGPLSSTPDSNTSSSLRDYIGTPGSNSSSSLRDYIRERNFERDRNRPRTREVRRRSSVVLSQAESTSTSAIRELPVPNVNLPAARAHYTSELPSGPGGSNPWQTIEAAMLNSRLPDAASRALRGPTGAGEANPHRRLTYERMERRRRQRIHDSFAEMESMGGRPAARQTRQYEREAGVGTTGCVMSKDGRKLFVGTEEGILEFRVNIQGRKCFPESCPR